MAVLLKLMLLKCFFCCNCSLRRPQLRWLCSLLMDGRKKLVYDVTYISVTHADLVHDVTDC